MISKKQEREFAEIITIEAGKPIKDALVEVNRAMDTFTIAAEEAVRRKGEYQLLDISSRNAGFSSIDARFPIGLISMITPFNFPLNLAAHKVAPAIAAGCPFVLKPSEKTPCTASLLGEILSRTSLPDDSYAVLPCQHEDAAEFSLNENIKLVSFTGSAAVGWKIKSTAIKQRTVLELGGNAACIVDAGVNIDRTVSRLVFGSFYSSGQSCISVQRLFVHEDVYTELLEKFKEATKALVSGDPFDEKTFLSPSITEADAIRITAWIKDAVDHGAKVLTGGHRHGLFVEPTILEGVSTTCDIYRKEVFGPVCLVQKYNSFEKICEEVNNSQFGLQAGIFTNDINKAFYAFDKLAVGGVVINDVPSVRVDSMPYGGTQDSGLRREGIRYAIEDMTEIKLLLLKDMGKLN